MDCFYAAVEMRDNPALRNLPIAVGGSANRRGVISTCNYLARHYGVRSAMASAYALRLCPKLRLIAGRMDLYKETSEQIRQIFKRYTDKIEPLSLDEAYLDVSECQLFAGSATLIAEDIRRTIYAETGLTASAGVAPCKFVAKVASDENKPNGICVIPPAKLDEFVCNLSLGKIPGVGKVTLEKLHHLGLYTCADVRKFPFENLAKRFGKFGPILWNRCHGIDERELTLCRQRKSVGVERTLAADIYTAEQSVQVLEKLYPKLVERLKKVSPTLKIKTQGIKLKFSDFQSTTVEHRQTTLDRAFFSQLLQEAMLRKGDRGIRLLGLHVGLSTNSEGQQLVFPFGI